MTLGLERKWEASEKRFQIALKLGAQHSTHRQFALYLLVHARYYEAWEHLQIAQSIDPFSNRQKMSMGRFFYCSRWHQEAAAYYREIAKFGELQIEPAYFYALTQIQMDEPNRALEIAERFQKHVGAVPTYLAGMAEVYALCHEEQKARELITRGNLLGKDTAASSYRKACLALALNDTATALEYLNDSSLRREPEILWIAVEPRFDGIKDHPAYLSIRKTIFPQ
jgi:tetratricopeptide (TPR) repeat protein